MKKPSVFPWRLFRWFVGNQFLMILLLFSVYYLAEWARIDALTEGELKTEQLALMRRSLGIGLLLTLGVTILMGRRLVTPMGRLIEKTRRMRKFPFAGDQLSEEELGLEETGEWYNLERAINKLGRDYRNKTVRLSREKTELRAIMAAIGEAVLAVDIEGKPLFYNNQFADLFRLQSWDERKVGLGEVVRSPDIVEGLRLAAKSGIANCGDLEIVLPGNKQAHHFKVTYTPLRKKHNDEVYGVVAVFMDQTKVKATEKMRIEFVANASHELRTPITPLKGYIQTLKEDLQSGRTEDVAQFLEVIERNVNRLSDLVSDLLDLSQLESDDALVSKPTSTRAVTERVLQQLDTRNHDLEVDLQVDEVLGDPVRIEQVLRNLLQNAVRYVPAGRRIEVHWEEGAEGKPCLRVKDFGPGIPEAHLSRLFERFYRVDVGRSRETGGTGIGLSLVKHIMQSHGGSVSVKSTPGTGTEFTCQF